MDESSVFMPSAISLTFSYQILDIVSPDPFGYLAHTSLGTHYVCWWVLANNTCESAYLLPYHDHILYSDFSLTHVHISASKTCSHIYIFWLCGYVWTPHLGVLHCINTQAPIGTHFQNFLILRGSLTSSFWYNFLGSQNFLGPKGIKRAGLGVPLLGEACRDWQQGWWTQCYLGPIKSDSISMHQCATLAIMHYN